MKNLRRIIKEVLTEARFKKGTDIGKKGKGFAKIAKSAAKKYGSEEAGKRVAGAILKKVLKEEEFELKFKNVERGRRYIATTDFGIFKKGDNVYVDTVRNLGTEVVLELTNDEGEPDSIKGDLGEEVEVFA